MSPGATPARAPRHHVLLVGIDAYEGGPLYACVNDIDAIRKICIDRVGIKEEHITRLAAPIGEAVSGATAPTLENVRTSLRVLGSEAVQEGDRVLIYYSGHGTQCRVTVGRKHQYLREALVPVDYNVDAEPRLLFDWELNELLMAIAMRTSAVTVILDCCSAAGATRGSGETPPAWGPGSDTLPARERFLPMSHAIELEAISAPVTRSGAPAAMTRGITRLLRGIDGCQVIAACRDTERARESTGPGRLPHGELTRALVHHLTAIRAEDLAEARWSWIWGAVETDVRAANSRQHPWLYGSFGRRIFGLGTDVLEHDPGIPIVRDSERKQFLVEAGTLAGITEQAELAIYGGGTFTFPALGTSEESRARLGTLRVESAERETSIAVAKAPVPDPLPPGARALLVRPGERAKLQLHVGPPEAASDVRVAAKDLVEVASIEDAEAYLVRQSDGGWTLTDDLPNLSVGEEVPRPVVAIPAVQRHKLRQVLEHYHAHRQPWRLAAACRDLESLLRVTLLRCDDRLPADRVQTEPLEPAPAGEGIPYAIESGGAVCIEVHNASTYELSVTVIDSTASGAVAILGQALVRPRSRHRFWDGGEIGKPFAASLPPGSTGGVDRIVAIGTTRIGHDLRHLARRHTWNDIIYGRASAPRSGGQEPGLWTSDVTALHIHTGPKA